MSRLFALGIALSFAALAPAVLAPTLVRAAEPNQKVVRLGFVGPSSPSNATVYLTAFRERLRELGWVEGQNLVIESRWADGQYDRLPSLMAEVVARKVDVIVTYGTPGAVAAKKATTTIPIVVASMGDPIGTGLATSLARPGGNLTGLSMALVEGLGGKWLEMLQDTVPRFTTVAVIMNPDNPVERDLAKELETIAAARHLKLRIIGVRDADAVEGALEQARQQAQAFVVFADAIIVRKPRQITEFAARHRLPAMYVMREFVDVGGLMAYGPNVSEMFRRAAVYVDKILKGTNPADLPIEQPTKFELVVNLKTAKALGITIPQSILLRADEVIR